MMHMSLHMCHLQIDAGGAQHVARMLRSNTTLRQLILDGCGLGDAGAEVLCEGLGHQGMRWGEMVWNGVRGCEMVLVVVRWYEMWK
jgi:hypothetical protein